ncbi:hypothetical protein IZU99_09615 [Oscillospiraceae bacterium CM]|nr:hypothetical protein IZU99_09615 [Oscillospiraceae bacterium CM]
MKKRMVLFVIAVMMCFVGCTSINNNAKTNNASMSENSNKYDSLLDETLNETFGGWWPDDFVNKFGKPEKTVNAEDYDRWYFKQGVEIDVVDQNDIPTLFNYIYIAPDSSIKLNRDIGIGSTRDDVLKAYEKEVNQKESNNHMLIAGDRYGGIIFIIEQNVVTSIYIATGAFTGVSEVRQIP